MIGADDNFEEVSSQIFNTTVASAQQTETKQEINQENSLESKVSPPVWEKDVDVR